MKYLDNASVVNLIKLIKSNFLLKDDLAPNSLIKGDGNGNFSTAVAGTDYAAINHTHTISQLDNQKPYYIGTTAPSNTRLLWIDTNNSLKFYVNGAWKTVPFAYATGDYKTITNLVGSIGSFESGTWNLTTDEKTYTNIATAHVKYGSHSLRMKGDTSVQERTYTLRNSSGQVKPTLTPNHKYYVRVETYQESKTGSCDIYWPIAEPSMLAGQNGAAGQWNICSTVVDRSSFSAGAQSMRIDYNNLGTDGMMYFDGLILVDLTADFGEGLEPDKAWCDKYIPYTDSTIKTTAPWF